MKAQRYLWILGAMLAYLPGGLLLEARAQNNEAPTHRFTMEEAVLYAVEHNPDLNKSRIDERIADQQIRQAKGSALPQISASGQFSDNFSLAEQQLPGEVFGMPGETIAVKFGVRYGVTGGVDISQTLYNQQIITAIKSSKSIEELYRLATLSTTEDLVFNVAKIYLQVQVTDRQRQIAQANYDRINQLTEITRSQYEEGLIKELDVKQLEVNRTNLDTELRNIDIGKNQQLNLLKFYLNISASEQLVLTDSLENEQRYPLQEELRIEENIAYRSLIQQLELSDLSAKAVKAEYMPTMSAFFNYSYQGQTDAFKFTGAGYSNFRSGLWGLRLNIPIFDGFQRRSRLQQARLETQKLKQDQISLKNSIEVDFANAVDQLALSEQQVENQLQNMGLAGEVYEATSLSYREGVAPLTELLDAEAGLREAQSRYLTALLQLQVADLEHIKASGQLAGLVETTL